VKLITDFHLVSRLRISGAVELLPFNATMAWAGTLWNLVPVGCSVLQQHAAAVNVASGQLRSQTVK
jgi:hypothetical protein